MVAAARRPGGDARSGRSGGSARAHDGEAGRRGGAGLRPAGASGADPDADAVAGEVKAPTAHQDRLKRQREVRREAVPLVAQSDLGNAVVAFVQSCWSEQGQGPTWGQVASRLGWAKPCTGAVVQGLVQAGRLEVGNEAASMRPGPAVRHSGGEERPT